MNEEEGLKIKERKIEPNGIKRTTCSLDHKNSHFGLSERERAKAYDLGEEEAIFGVIISPYFGVLLDQVKEGNKEKKEMKKMKARLKSFKKIKVMKLS